MRSSYSLAKDRDGFSQKAKNVKKQIFNGVFLSKFLKMFYYFLVQRLYVVVGNDVGYGGIKLLFVTFSCEKQHGKILECYI